MRSVSFVRPAVATSVLLLFLFCLSTLLPTARAADDSPWMAGPPEFSAGPLVEHRDYVEVLKNRKGFNPGATCIEKKIETQILGSIRNRYVDGCWYNTSIGLLHSTGLYLLENGTSRAGALETHSHSGNQSHLYATANPDVFVERVPHPDSTEAYLQFRSVSQGGLVMDHDVNPVWGSIKLDFRNAPSLALKSPGGNALVPNKLSTWWSQDSKHMLLWGEKSGALYRVNVETFEVLMIPVHDNASNANLHGSVAMSPSGRYVAVALEEKRRPELYVIDLESCIEVAGEYVNQAADCDMTSYKDLLESEIDSYLSPRMPRFYGEHTLSFYHYPRGSGPLNGYTQYFLQANGTERQESKYVALGDSYSSGEGAGNYEPDTDLWRTNECHTSRNSYPYLINNQLNLDFFLSVACSGARIEHVETTAQHEFPAQDDIYPGNYPQLEAVDETSPDIITITMSGNDIGFGEKLLYCLGVADECYSTRESRKGIANEIDRLRRDLVKMYEKILDQMDSRDARLYILGYPQIASVAIDAKCEDNVWLNAYQRQMANDLITYFNAVIKSAADEAGAYYVGTEGSLGGHKLCEGSPASVAVNGMTVGADMLAHKASFHPNEIGHELLKNWVLEKTNNFTEKTDGPNQNPQIPNAEDYPFLDAPSSGGTVWNRILNPNPDGIDLNIIERGKKKLIEVIAPDIPLLPNEVYEVFLHSDPVHLGQVNTDGAGYINAEIGIPEDTPSGMHELHIRGTDLDGKPISVYEYVYVAVSETDFDGDGIPNTEESCGIFEPSGNDRDQDGTDDACDPVIGNPPEQTSNSAQSQDEEESLAQGAQSQDVTTANAIRNNQVVFSDNSGGALDDGTALSHKAPDEDSSPPNMVLGIQSEEGFKGWLTKALIATGITLLVILSYSVIKYGIVNKKE